MSKSTFAALPNSSLFEPLEARKLLAAAAADDSYEPNDTPRQVLSLTSPGGPWLGAVEGDLSIAGLKLADRADWFRFRLTTEGQPGDDVAIAFKHRRGNLDLALFNARGRVQLDSSATNRATESVSLDGLPAGWYMVKVSGRDNATNPNYRLSFDAPVDSPTDDDNGGDPIDDGDPIPLVELNDSFDLVDSAPVGATGSPNLGTFSGPLALNGQTLDDTYDIFKFTIAATPSANASISISSPHAFNLSLFNSSRQSIGFASGYMGQTSLSLSGLAPGEYYVQVTHYVLGLDGAFDYDLAFDPGAAA
jgi:hypothetical protein